jgi:dolichol-phosphate mannosyltransferase
LDRERAAAVSNHFNLTVELPLKAIVRGHSYAVVPTSRTKCSAGQSSLDLLETGSGYLYIVLMMLLEHGLSRRDYRRADYHAYRPGFRRLRRRLAHDRMKMPTW